MQGAAPGRGRDDGTGARDRKDIMGDMRGDFSESDLSDSGSGSRGSRTPTSASLSDASDDLIDEDEGSEFSDEDGPMDMGGRPYDDGGISSGSDDDF